MADFRHIDSSLYGADNSYSTLLLNRLRENGQWVSQKWGTHTTLTYEAYNNDDAQQAYERPIVSVGQYSAFLRVPWAIESDLSTLHFRVFCRVSNGLLDNTGGEVTIASNLDYVMLKAQVLGDSGVGSVWVSPFRDAGKAAEWGWAEFSYDIGNLEVFGGKRYGTLALGMQSKMPMGLTDTWSPGAEPTSYGYIDEAGFDTGVSRSAWRLKANTDGFYGEGSTTGAPVPDANEIIASAIIQAEQYSTRHIRAWTGHMRKDVFSTDHGRSMQIWPPTDVHVHGDNGDGTFAIAKFYVPYLQVRAVEIWSEYA